MPSVEPTTRHLLAVALHGENTFWLCIPIAGKVPTGDWKQLTCWWLYPYYERSEFSPEELGPSDSLFEVDFTGTSKVARFATITTTVCATPLECGISQRPRFYSISREEMDRVNVLYRQLLEREGALAEAAQLPGAEPQVAISAGASGQLSRREADRSSRVVAQDAIPEGPTVARRGYSSVAAPRSAGRQRQEELRRRARGPSDYDDEDEEYSDTDRDDDDDTLSSDYDDDDEDSTASFSSSLSSEGGRRRARGARVRLEKRDPPKSAVASDVTQWTTKYIWHVKGRRPYLCQFESGAQRGYPLHFHFKDSIAVYTLFPNTTHTALRVNGSATAVECENMMAIPGGSVLRVFVCVRSPQISLELEVACREHEDVKTTLSRQRHIFNVDEDAEISDEICSEAARGEIPSPKHAGPPRMLRIDGLNRWTDGVSWSRAQIEALAQRFPVVQPPPGEDLCCAVLPSGECVTYSRASAEKHLVAPREAKKISAVSDDDMRGLLSNILLAKELHGNPT